MAEVIRALLLAATAAGAVFMSGCGHDGGDGDEDAALTEPVPVKVCRAKVVTLHPALDLVGTVTAIPERSASVSPRIDGWVTDLLVVEGDTVRANQELLRFDSRVTEINVEKAKASMQEKEAALARLQHGNRPEEIEMARADAEQAKAKAGALRAQVEAAKSLHEKAEMSHVRYGNLTADLQAAEAAYAAAEANRKLLEAGARREDIAQAEAQLAAAKADFKNAELTLKFCAICSPFDGRVTRLSAQKGMFAQQAAVLATVTDLSSVFVRVRIPSAYQAKLPIGAEARVSVAALPGQSFQGTFTRISGQANPVTGDVDAFVKIANPKRLLQPGFGCRVHLLLREVKDALAVPIVAVADRDGTPVLTVVRDGKAYETEVTLGEKTRDLVEITAPLSAGDLVVTEGGYGLPPGCPVKVMSE